MVKRKEDSAIVIIGAGIAGLTIAEHLFYHGFKNITILEATGRIGGRIQTQAFGQSRSDFVELGAQYIGAMSSACSTYVLANQANLGFNQQTIDWPIRTPAKGLVYSSGGGILDPGLVKKVDELFIKHFQVLDEQSRPISMDEGLTEILEQNILPQFEELERDDVRSYYNFFRNWLRVDDGIELDKIRLTMEDTEIIPAPSTEASGPMVTLIQEITKRFPSSFIHLSSPVTQISWGDHLAEITCSTGTTTTTHMADHVFVTIPLGYLKQHHMTIFEPKLPERKVAAIRELQFGKIGKIFLEFDEAFWEMEKPEMLIAWKDGGEEWGWARYISHFEGAADSSNVLIAWIGCDGAAQMEKLSEKEVGETLIRLLMSLFSNPSIPHPKRVLKSSWCSHPWTLGVYAGRGAPWQRDDLAEPLQVRGVPRVLFAGEAVEKKYPGYMHGARDSALTAAEEVVQMYQRESDASVNSKL